MLSTLSSVWAFITGGWKWILGGLIASALAYGAWTMYTDYTSKVDQIVSLQQNNARLEVVNEQNERALEEQRRFAERQRQLRRELEEELNSAEDRVRELQRTLSEHDLEYLALERPGLIERRINDATDDVFCDIERDTGGVCSTGTD